MASILGSVSGPQNGGRFVGKILVTRRKIARVSIVSAGTGRFPYRWVSMGSAAGMSTHVLELGRPSVARPVFARVFGPQTGVQKNPLFPSLEGAKSLENQWNVI